MASTFNSARPSLPRRPAQERGVVLIMALLIVVLVTAVVVAVSWRFTLSMARNENRWHGSQARAYIEGGEQLARKVLREDETPDVDFMGDLWAQSGEALPTDEGWIRGTIEDAHSRFNLNLLLTPPPVNPDPNNPNNNPPPDPNDWLSLTESQRRFVRLLQTIELESGPVEYQTAMEIMQAVQDWLDADAQVTGFGGAEADFYENQDPPYPITNGPMTSVSELSLVKGMTPEIYEKLVPLVIALPPDVHMNINTLKPELLRALNLKESVEPLTAEDATMLDEARKAATEGIRDINEFVNSAGGLFGNPDSFDSSHLVVKSHYFIFNAETLVGEQVRRSKSLLFRGGGDVQVVRRTDANF